MSHLRKRLAAAEAINLHLVEAGDLHSGAGKRRPWLLQGPSAGSRRLRASESKGLPGAG